MAHLNILGKKVPIVKVKEPYPGTEFAGWYDYAKETIFIVKGTNENYLPLLIHEAVHALFARGGVFQTKMPREVEEIIAEQVALMITENFDLKLKAKR